MTRAARRPLAAIMASILCVAHIGSPDVWFAGRAGPYPLRALVRMPRTIPGVAEIIVEIPDGAARSVRVQTFDVGAGERFQARPEPIRSLAQGRYAGRLWFMTEGAHGVRIEVAGVRGRGEVIVPVVPIERQRAPLSAVRAAGFAALLAFLVAAAAVIVAAAAREGSLAEGEPVSASRRRAGRRAGTLTAISLVIALAIMGTWWRRADAGFARRAYRPPPMAAAVGTEGGRPVLSVTIGGRENRSPLTLEHGRLMHVFLLREPHLDAFAHLHPTTRDSVRFTARIPPLPAGQYRLIAEIVEQDGFPVTMASRIDLVPTPEPGRPCRECRSRPDPEDAWSVVVGSPDARRSVADDGSTFVRVAAPEALRAGEEAGLRFAVLDPDGGPARLEPYLGMVGHAVVARMDGGVFAHLHPGGTVSMAAQELAGAQASDMSAANVESHLVSFPYGFPSPGDYRVFVQVKREGRIMTGVFDLRVTRGGALESR